MHSAGISVLRRWFITLFAVPFLCVTTAFSQQLPDHYPEDYSEIIEASRAETGILVYGIMPEASWRPVISAFQELYPWIEVNTLDLGTSEVFERYYAEVSGGGTSASLIVSVAVDGWLRFIDRGELLPYDSPEKPELPEWSYNEQGLYTYSTDPVVMAYSQMHFGEDPPRGIAHLAELVAENPDFYDGKLTTYQVEPQLSTFWTFFEHHEEEQFWEWLDTLGPATRPTTSSGGMVDGLMTGQYVAAYFSGIGNPRRAIADPSGPGARLIGYRYIEDGNPVWVRGIGIPQHSATPNSAKLLLDFILSHDGQVAVAEGGYTPYRPDTAGVASSHRQEVVDQIGEENVLQVEYDRDYLNVELMDDFIARWRRAMFGE